MMQYSTGDARLHLYAAKTGRGGGGGGGGGGAVTSSGTCQAIREM